MFQLKLSSFTSKTTLIFITVVSILTQCGLIMLHNDKDSVTNANLVGYFRSDEYKMMSAIISMAQTALRFELCLEATVGMELCIGKISCCFRRLFFRLLVI